MAGVSKVAISLPDEVLEMVEREREATGESRSDFFRHAATELLRARRLRDLNERYMRAYEQCPETPEEVEAALRSGSAILAQEPWD